MQNRLYLTLELCILFMGIPLVFYFELVAIPKIAALLGVALFVVLVLWFDEELDFSQLFTPPGEKVSARHLIKRSIAVVLTVCGLVLILHPSEFFYFPREQPVVWMVVMLLYPLLSALPQELTYREFFFQRYRTLFPSEMVLGIASALAFSTLHIIYDNGWAIGLSLVAGFMFVETYRKSKSLYWVTVEHTLYGCLVFTLGMGRYFYEAF